MITDIDQAKRIVKAASCGEAINAAFIRQAHDFIKSYVPSNVKKPADLPPRLPINTQRPSVNMKEKQGYENGKRRLLLAEKRGTVEKTIDSIKKQHVGGDYARGVKKALDKYLRERNSGATG